MTDRFKAGDGSDAASMHAPDDSPKGHPSGGSDKLVDGKYRLRRQVGEGGMGAVFEAEHVGLGTKVAVKLLSEGFTADTRAVSRFRREARAAAAIQHPNIVAVHDTGTTEEGAPFLVMELLEGESLSSLLRRERKLSPTVATAVACQMLAGLAAAHEKRIIHRDLKPGNVVVAREPDGSRIVKILDFGISKFFSDPLASDVTASGGVVGTPRFMAPEQARGQSDLDARVDLYGVGVLLYRMVTGRLPATGSSQQEIIAKILAGNPTPPRELEPTIPPELERVILKSLAVSRDQRYLTAQEFVEDLRQAMPEVTDHAPIAIPVSALDHAEEAIQKTASSNSIASLVAEGSAVHALAQRPTGRGLRLLLLGLATVAVLLLVGLVVLWVTSRGPQVERRKPAPAPRSFSGIAGQQYSGTPIRIGMSRYLPRELLVEENQPLLVYLADALKRPVQLHIFYDFVDLAKMLNAGTLDLVDLPPYAYVRATAQKTPLKLLCTHVTEAGDAYQGLIVVRASSPIQSLSQLRNKVFCYVHPGSSSGYLYPRALLRQAGLDPDRSFKATRLTGGHLAAIRALHSGACDGAAVFSGMLLDDVRRHDIPPQEFRIVARTERIPHDAYCVPEHQRPSTTRQLQDALLALEPGSPLASQVLGKRGHVRGFVTVKDSAFDTVRRIAAHLDRPIQPR